MLARTAQPPAWSKQAYVCRACRRQLQISHQQRWNSQQHTPTSFAAAATSDSWLDTINNINDEYSSDRRQSGRKSPRARLEDSRTPQPGATSTKSLQNTWDTTSPAQSFEESASSPGAHESKNADFKAAFLSGQSRHRDRGTRDVAATSTKAGVQGVVQANQDILANLLGDLKADAKTMAEQQDEGFDRSRQEQVEHRMPQREHAEPIPFPSFRGRSRAVDYVDVPAGQTTKAAANEVTAPLKVWKAKTSPTESGLGGSVVARAGPFWQRSLLDRHRDMQPRSAWGATEERASRPHMVTFNTLAKADQVSPKKETETSLTKRPFGFVDRVKTLWRGPANQTALEEVQEHASSEPELVSRKPDQADDLEDLVSDPVTQSETKGRARAETALERAPWAGNMTDQVPQQNAERPTVEEQHTNAQLVDASLALLSQADSLATDTLAKLHAGVLQLNEGRTTETVDSGTDQSAQYLTRARPNIRKVHTTGPTTVWRYAARSTDVPSKAHSEQSLSALTSIAEGMVVNTSPRDDACSQSELVISTQNLSISESSENHGGNSSVEAIEAKASTTAGMLSADRVGVSLADPMKDAPRSKPLRKQAHRKARGSNNKAQATHKPMLMPTPASAPVEIEPAVDTQIADRGAADHYEAADLGEAAEQSHVDVLSAQLSKLEIQPVDIPQPPVPYLEYGLSRVLFNPGVYQLQDAASRVYNFDPYLQKIMPIEHFDFNALKKYKTSSQDTALAAIAKQQEKRYIGSTSSMTSSLAHFHYLISNWRPLNLGMLSHGYVGKSTRKDFTKINKAPSAIFLRWKDGSYAIDADKEFDSANVLMLLGKSMELLLTLPKDEYEKYRKSDPRTVSEEQRTAPESYQYTTMGDFLMRSQLDAYDPRLPGNGTFDLKTRAVVSIRMSAHDHEKMTGYEIYGNQGRWSSYEKEYHDMARATMLKYMLQARMGRMNGIFVAYHNVKRIFGFQYIPIADMDLVLHGQSDTCLGDQEFKASLKILNDLLNKATSKYPEQSLRIHFEAQSSADAEVPTSLHMFAEPMPEQEIDEIQNKQKEKIAEYERTIMGKEAASDEAGSSRSNDRDEASPAQSMKLQHQASDYAREQLSYESTDGPADETFLDQVQEERETAGTKLLFYATAIVQSEVNGSVVTERPENLKKEDDWTLNYLIKEYEVTRHHWALYDDMKARRRQALYFEREEADEAEGEAEGKPKVESGYIAFLESMSKQGEAIREQQDLADQASGSNVVQVEEPLPRVREKVETLEDYIEWMYRKEQE